MFEFIIQSPSKEACDSQTHVAYKNAPSLYMVVDVLTPFADV